MKKTKSLDAIHAKKIAKYLKVKNINININYDDINKKQKILCFSRLERL